jgi:hypothetical protein
MNLSEEIKKLQALHESGTLTDDEFTKAKSKLIESAKSPSEPSQNAPSEITSSPKLTSETASSSAGWLAPLVIVIGVFALFFIFSDTTSDDNNRPEESDKQESQQVELHGTYYIFISLIELAEKDPEGRDWDEGGIFSGPSAPEPWYSVELNDKVIFSTRDDSGDNNFLKEWSGIAQGLFLGSGTISPEGIIKAPLVSAEDKNIRFYFYDEDADSAESCGGIILNLTTLDIGEEEWWRWPDVGWRNQMPAADKIATRGVKRIRIKVIQSNKKAEYIAQELGIPLREVKSRLGL